MSPHDDPSTPEAGPGEALSTVPGPSGVEDGVPDARSRNRELASRLTISAVVIFAIVMGIAVLSLWF